MARITRGKGEGALFRVPADTSKPLQFWQAVVELPPRDGERRRKIVRSKDKRIALTKLREVQRDLAKVGDLPTASQTLESWLRHWFDHIHAKRVRPKTIATQRGIIDNHIIPAIGGARLNKLEPLHVRRLHEAIADKGLSSTTALQAHRILGTALRDAEREGRVTRNVTTLTDAPRRARPDLAVLDLDDGIRILLEAAQPGDRMGSRWATALLTGARQGEVLGLEIDRVADKLDLSWQLQRLTWSHGCNPQNPRQPKCDWKRGSDCPKRHLEAPADWEHRHLTGGLWLSRPKSAAGWREIPLVDPLREIIERRIEVARRERNPHGLVWTADPKRTPQGLLLPLDGSPVDPGADNRAWHDLLARAGVHDARLHDARHTTVDLLYEAEVSETVITEIVGHSTIGMTRRYRSRGNQRALRDALTKMSALLAPGVVPDPPQPTGDTEL
jgi:integrase